MLDAWDVIRSRIFLMRLGTY